jgi:hypothetical protein
MIWEIILTFIVFISAIFIIMYVLFMCMINETGLFSFKQMNRLFWAFFKEYFGFTSKNSLKNS